MIEAVLLFYLLKGLNHETPQNVLQIKQETVFQHCFPHSQEKRGALSG